jgi:hypothetical protein
VMDGIYFLFLHVLSVVVEYHPVPCAVLYCPPHYRTKDWGIAAIPSTPPPRIQKPIQMTVNCVLYIVLFQKEIKTLKCMCCLQKQKSLRWVLRVTQIFFFPSGQILSTRRFGKILELLFSSVNKMENNCQNFDITKLEIKNFIKQTLVVQIK